MTTHSKANTWYQPTIELSVKFQIDVKLESLEMVVINN